jgi:hypothetical protein
MSLKKSMPRRNIAVALTALVIGGAYASAEPPKLITLLITPHYQQASQLCWAATSQMAVNTLVAAGSLGREVDQKLLAVYNREGVSADQLRQGGFDKKKICDLRRRLEFCGDIFACSRPGDPILVGLDPHAPSSGKLGKKAIKERIGTLERPFIFSWKFAAGPGSAPSGSYHYLMAVGYDATDPSDFRLIIWDPWPVPTPGSPAPTSADFKSISYKTYKNPGFDNSGLYSTYLNTWSGFAPVAGHPAIPPPLTPPTPDENCDLSAAVPIVNSPTAGTGSILRPNVSPIAFERALVESLTATQRERKLRELAGRFREDLDIGDPFLITTLSLDDLRNPGRALALLRERRTYIVLYPVTAGRKLVDSFLMARSVRRWTERGYANNEITRRLVGIRTTSLERGRVRRGEMYYLSIPQLRAFFGAYDRDGRTRLISTTTDPAIGIRENEEAFAEDILARIARSTELIHR